MSKDQKTFMCQADCKYFSGAYLVEAASPELATKMVKITMRRKHHKQKGVPQEVFHTCGRSCGLTLSVFEKPQDGAKTSTLTISKTN